MNRLVCQHLREPNPRLANVDQLIRDDVLLGMDAEQARQLLGPSHPDVRMFRDWDSHYYVRPRAYCVDSDWLVLRFGPDGKVTEVRIVND
jgi:hypothetical protein